MKFNPPQAIASPALPRGCVVPMLFAKIYWFNKQLFRQVRTQHAREALMATQSLAATLAQLGVAGVVMLGTAQAAEIKVLGSPGTKEPYTLLVPEFEKASGHKVVTTWDGVNNVHKRIAAGEIFDVVMVPVAQTDDLIKQGKLVPDSRVVVATSGVGVAIRAGAPKPEMTADGIKKALLSAKSIAYSTGPSGVHIARLIETWGIADQVRGKIVPPRTGTPIGEVVARGEADIGFQQVSELLPVKGIDYLGPLPLDINEITAFAAAVHKAASVPDAGRALLKFLTAPAAAATIRKTGMEPG
jgi:molybdate transport system substrate-binding protein